MEGYHIQIFVLSCFSFHKDVRKSQRKVDNFMDSEGIWKVCIFSLSILIISLPIWVVQLWTSISTSSGMNLHLPVTAQAAAFVSKPMIFWNNQIQLPQRLSLLSLRSYISYFQKVFIVLCKFFISYTNRKSRASILNSF